MHNDPLGFFSTVRWTAGVVGLGYVGLPLLVTATQADLGAIGFDTSTERVRSLLGGQSGVDDVSAEDLVEAFAGGASLTTEPSDLRDADALFICVPSPLGRNRQPDLSYLEAASATIEQVARPGQLISLESTSYPGTTEDFILPALQRVGLRVDEDVFVAFSPERVSPGSGMGTKDIPKVVGGVTALSGQVAAAAYGRLVTSVHLVSSARVAEMSKLLENTYRAVNIGLVNEMAQLAHELDIDIWEVIDAAATKPFGYQAFYPGPGVGGHCIPLDPQYLAWRAKAANFTTRFIDTAEEINAHMPAYTVARITELLNQRGLPVSGAEVLALGIAYKPDIADDRESAALDVLRKLKDRGARITVLDELVGAARVKLHGYEAMAEQGDFRSFDVAIVLTDHDGVDYAAVARQVPLVFDTRGVFRRIGVSQENVVSL
jgi:UDP-N-acetyl-D-glucosamine dehydrogenase